VTDIRQWHKSRGYLDVGYHYVITRTGEIQKGRPDTMHGAHEVRINRRSISVCLVGGSPPIGSDEHRKGLGENNFTDDQWFALAKLIQVLAQEHPDAEVLGHRDVEGVRKACPSFDAKQWWEAVSTHIEQHGALPLEVIRG
jgi:N-acetyl-anhydromuramyl-L-alanine amidase AmpD